MDYPDRRHDDCIYTHIGLAGCRECKRLYDRDRALEEKDDVASARLSVPSEEVSRAPSGGCEVEAETGKAPALTPAEKQKRYRERHGDEYRKREAARQKRRRQELKDG